MLPRAKKDGADGLSVRREGTDLVVSSGGSAHRLAPLAAFLFTHADGTRPVSGLAADAGAALGRPVSAEDVWSALDLLADRGLLVSRVAPPTGAQGFSRRELLHKAVVTGAAAAASVVVIARPGLARGESLAKDEGRARENELKGPATTSAAQEQKLKKSASANREEAQKATTNKSSAQEGHQKASLRSSRELQQKATGDKSSAKEGSQKASLQSSRELAQKATVDKSSAKEGSQKASGGTAAREGHEKASLQNREQARKADSSGGADASLRAGEQLKKKSSPAALRSQEEQNKRAPARAKESDAKASERGGDSAREQRIKAQGESDVKSQSETRSREQARKTQ